MSEYRETVTTTKEDGVDNTGAQVEQNTRTVDTSSSAGGQSVATNIVWYIVGFIEVMLALRFSLKLFGANPGSGFVDFVYGITDVLTAPFDTIFGVARNVSGPVVSVFEPSILVAAAVYALVGWGIVKLLNIDRPA